MKVNLWAWTFKEKGEDGKDIMKSPTRWSAEIYECESLKEAAIKKFQSEDNKCRTVLVQETADRYNYLIAGVVGRYVSFSLDELWDLLGIVSPEEQLKRKNAETLSKTGKYNKKENVDISVPYTIFAEAEVSK